MTRNDRGLVVEKVREYVQKLRENDVAVWQVYLFGSYARGTQDEESDIDLAVCLDKDDVDVFEEGVLLKWLRRGVDIRIEPHVFARSDLEDQNPVIREILRTGQRIS